MDDPRIEWLRDRVYLALDIKDPERFEDLVDRDEGEAERLIAKFLNETPEELADALIFYKTSVEEEEEVEVECEPSIPDITADQEVEGEGQNEDGGENAENTEAQAAETSPTAEVVSPETATDDKKKGKKSRSKRSSAASGSTPTAQTPAPPTSAPQTPKVEEPPPPPPEEPTAAEAEEDAEPPPPKTKIVIEKVWKTYLHLCYGNIAENCMDHECIYFLRNTEGMVPLPNNIEEANQVLPSLFEFGILNGHSLVMLEQIITQVYMPMLSYNAHKNAPSSQSLLKTDLPEEGKKEFDPDNLEALEKGAPPPVPSTPQDMNMESANKAMLRDEFLINMSKFSSSISRTIQQIEGEVKLECPELPGLTDNQEENLRKELLMQQVEEVARGWYQQIHSALEIQQKKTPQGNGPLAEIDYWRERNAALSALFEQLKSQYVK